jgi:hypothetical protein
VIAQLHREARMHRRAFLAASLSLAATPAGAALLAARVTIRPQDALNTLPADFTGLSYETSQLSDPDFFSPSNTGLVALCRQLSANGVLRLGGNSSEFCWWNDGPDAHEPALRLPGQGDPQNWMPQTFYPITPRAIDNLAGFLDATGWRLIYGLNFGTGAPDRDAVEADYVARAVGPRLKYFQIGNEPDLYRRANNRVRPPGWDFPDYFSEWTAIADAVSARVPNARFGGPDVASSSDWVARFADIAAPRMGERLITLSGHYYASGPPDDPAVNIENLLAGDARVADSMAQIMPAARRAGLPYRMTEGNSCYRGGKAGMSNAFAAALWGGDYALRMAALGCSGVNFHGGGGRIISAALGDRLPGARDARDLEIARLGTFYSPIAGARDAGFSARPIFYAMMLADRFAGATMLGAACDSGGADISAYAARADGEYRIALFNKDAARDIEMDIAVDGAPLARATLWRLAAASLDAIDGTRLAGAEVSDQRPWSARRVERPRAHGGRLRVTLPRASAALVFATPR